jgi:hyperosmotically inducible protein
MNIVPSRIVIGVGLAIVGAGLVTYALHPSSTPAPIARVAPIAPPPPVVQAPEAPPPAAPAPDVAAPTPAAPAAVAQTDNGTASSDATPAAPEPKASRHSKAHRSVDSDSVASTTPAAPAAPAPAADTAVNSDSVAKNGDSVKPADDSTAPAAPAAATTPADGAQAVDVANADSKITTEVKSRLAADSVAKDADISVNTTQGVVVLTGTVASQDAVDHVKLVAQNVPDVKSVDTSALKVSG